MKINDVFEFESYDFDYIDCVLNINYYDANENLHTTKEISAMSDTRIKKIEINNIYKAILIDGSDKVVLCSFTTEQLYSHIRGNYYKNPYYTNPKFSILRNERLGTGTYNVERFFWNYLEGSDNEFWNSFWLNGLTNETIDELYDKIMNNFIVTKIKKSIMGLSQKDICSKFKEYLENDDLEYYKKWVENHFNKLPLSQSDCEEVSEFISNQLYSYKIGLTINDVTSKYGTYFENEDNELEKYKSNLEENLNNLPYDCNEISDFILNKLNDIKKEIDYWLQISNDYNTFCDSGWVKKYISILNVKASAFMSVCNQYLAQHSDDALSAFKAELGQKCNRSKKFTSSFDYGQENNVIVNYITDNIEAVNERKHNIQTIRTELFSENSVEDKYLDMLEAQIKLLESSYENYIKQTYGDIPEIKRDILNILNSMSFNDALSLYRKYRELITQTNPEYKGHGSELYALYYEYFTNGAILISDYLNRINKKKDKQKSIAKSDYETAMTYFYGSDFMDEVNELRDKGQYLADKENGAEGEKEVEYALKWLDKEYITISKTSVGKYGELSILLHNPDFIDEPQEYDHIIIGKQGVFLIETKNYAGKLIVDKNGNWIREKKDGSQEGERNPIQQIRRHEKLMQSIIGDDINIISIICMAHPKMIIAGVENCSIPIVKSDLLVEFIESYQCDKLLSSEEMRICLETINKYKK